MICRNDYSPRTMAGIAAVLLLFSVSYSEETVCIQCHSAQSGRLSEPVGQWQTSIHAANRVSCHHCHGGDPADAANAMNPARGFIGVPKEAMIPKFCGRCHVGVVKDYLESRHGALLGKGGPTCVTCHGNHAVIKAGIEIINQELCSGCHSYERAALIRGALQPTEAHLVRLENELNAARKRGVDVEQISGLLFSVRNRYHSLFHELNVDRVQTESERNRADLEKVERFLADLRDEQKKRSTIGSLAVGFSLIAALLFHLLRKTYR